MQTLTNGEESLQLIQSMINKAKNNFSETGTLYLFWGFVILICSIGQFVAIHFFQAEKTYYVWSLTWLMALYQIIFLKNKAKKATVKTYTEEIVKYVWICFVSCLLLLSFILIKLQAYNCILPAILVMYGIPTFLSGIILQQPHLIRGGLFCWILSIGSIFVAYQYQLLFIAAAVLVAWIVPGIHLRKRYLKENISYAG